MWIKGGDLNGFLDIKPFINGMARACLCKT